MAASRFPSRDSRLEPGTTKNDEGRTFPFALLPPLKALLESQKANTEALQHSIGRSSPGYFIAMAGESGTIERPGKMLVLRLEYQEESLTTSAELR
jgi:hypothetical protein